MLQQLQRPLHTHQPQTAASLAQTMSLLHLTSDELRQSIERELSENPALELTHSPHCPACGRKSAQPGLCPICAIRPGAQVVVFSAPAVDFHESGSSRPRQDPFDATEHPETAETLSLATHLLRQISTELAREDRPIAAHLLTGLDDDGLLGIDPAEVAAYFHIPSSRVERVRQLIQRGEPLGCGSRSAREAVAFQLSILQETEPVPPAANACLAQFKLLAHHDFDAIATASSFSRPEIEAAASFISANLNPYPARAWWGTPSATHPPATPVYRTPDILLRWLDDAGATLVVELTLPFAGRLRLNPLFQQARAEDESGAFGAAIERARLLIKSLHQRQTALEVLLTRLVSLQRDFIMRGEGFLRPLTRASLAADLGFHESTISRAVAAKSVQLPNGHIIPLARFFERNLSVRTALKELIANEASPLSDEMLTAALKKLGFALSRRAVTKYRLMEGIASSQERKRMTA
jgi:RNA polymerase sigma-54 factor